jgi:hypothetical protein
MSEQVIDLLRLVAAGIVGGLIGAFASHKLTSHRERESGRASRRRDFLAFLNEWSSEFKRAATIEIFSEHFGATISMFSGEAHRIRADFIGDDRQKFDALVAAVSKYTRPQIYGEMGDYKKFMAAIDDLIAYVDT